MSKAHLGLQGPTGGSCRAIFLCSLRASRSPSCELSTQWSEEGASALLSRVQSTGGQPCGSVLPGHGSCSALLPLLSGQEKGRLGRVAQIGTYPSAAVKKGLHLREMQAPDLRVQQPWVSPVPWGR